MPTATDSSIIKLSTRAVNVPLANPVRTASGNVTHAPLLLIDVHCASGIVGHAYLFTYTPLVLKPLKLLIDELAPLVIGAPMAAHAVQQIFDSKFRLLGNTGLVTMAFAGIDMAIWDAMAKQAHLPLYAYLGGKRGDVPAYLSRGMDGIDGGISDARECLEGGFSLLKIKTGYPDIKQDIAVIEAVLRTLDGNARLAVDFNQSLNFADAIIRCHRFDDLGLAWIEEPLKQDDYLGHAKLATQVKTPIMLGENWYGVQEMAKAVAVNAGDIVMPDLMKIGGVSGWLKAASIANAAQVPMCSHLFQEFSAHLMTVTDTAYLLEHLDFAGPILEKPTQFKNGAAVLNEQPGSGVEWNEAAVAQYLVN